MAKTKTPEKTRPPLKMPSAEELFDLSVSALSKFSGGTTDELESAIGMLFMGHAFGWRVIYVTHSIATVRRNEKILGIVAKDVFPADTPHSDRIRGYRIAETVSNFWKAVKGEHQHEGFRDRTVESA